MGWPSAPLPGFSGRRKVLSPRSFISVSVRRAPSPSHQLMTPDAEEAPARRLLQLGDVLVVDAEAALAEVLVGQPHQAEERVGEGELAVDAVGLELAQAGVDVGGARPGERVVLHEHGGELAGQERAAADGEVPGAVVVHDPRGLLLQLLGEPLVEDVVGQRDVVVGREHLRCPPAARWRRRRVALAVLRRTEALGRIGERASCVDMVPLPLAEPAQNTSTS